MPFSPQTIWEEEPPGVCIWQACTQAPHLEILTSLLLAGILLSTWITNTPNDSCYRTRMSKTDRMKQDGQRGPWKGGTALQTVQAEGGWQFAQLWACTMYRLLESRIGWCIHSIGYKESAVYHFQLLVFSLFLPFCLPPPSMSFPVIPAILWLSQQRMSTDSVNATQWQPAIFG